MPDDRELIAARAREFESLKLVAYLCEAGTPTIGYGHTKGVANADVGRRTCTATQAEAWLREDVADIMAELDRKFGWWRTLPAGPRLALADMAFNLGIPRLSGFKRMLAALARKDYATAATEARDSRWFQQVGRRARQNVALIAKGE